MASQQRSRAKKGSRRYFTEPKICEHVIDTTVMEESDSDESALESELEALLGDKTQSRPVQPKKKVTLVAAVINNEPIPIDFQVPYDDEDDDDEALLTDPELLEELQSLVCDSSKAELQSSDIILSEEIEEVQHSEFITTQEDIVSVLKDRLNLYKDALAAAIEIVDIPKTESYKHAIKTLEDLLKSASLGKAINEEDIPPVINVPKVTKTSSPTEPKEVSPQLPVSVAKWKDIPMSLASEKLSETENIQDDAEVSRWRDIPISIIASEKPSKTENIQDDIEVPVSEVENACKILIARRDGYKSAAVQAKRAGDQATALEYLKISKKLQASIEAVKNAEPVNLMEIPPLPPTYFTGFATSGITPSRKDCEQIQTSSSLEAAAFSAASEQEDPVMFSAPPPPASILQALEQRLDKYKATKADAMAKGNTSKVRRLQRIIYSYEKAIEDFKAGKTVNFEELPSPPGFAPIPVPSQSNISTTAQNKTSAPESKDKPKPEVKPPVPSRRPAPQPPSADRTEPQSTQKRPIVRRRNTLYEKQLEFLLERQKLFREAAVAAKKNGDIEQAKEYLRKSKGFDPMIEATKCGLPIDTSDIPTPPQLLSDFVVVDVAECVKDIDVDSAKLIETLERDLCHQIEVCTHNKEHFLRLGCVTSASKFEKLGLDTKRDLLVIQQLKRTGGPAPKFHYETRLFSMVQCHTDLGDNELEVTVERGINLPGKADELDSYVKIELLIPSDAPQKMKTHTVKDTNNPIFQEVFKFDINRKSRTQLRQFKRQALKLEVWSKGGFLRSDTLLGTASVKLVDLESKCSVHESFDLMDGRKACGGKLEIRVRIRDPLLCKQVEEVKQKWLVIEN